MGRAARKYNKLMVLGTAAAEEDGTLYLSDLGERRCDRAAEAYFGSEFERGEASILVSGGYGKDLFEAPPLKREARLMADYLIRQYAIPNSALLLEDESKDTMENFTFSRQQYPEFFEPIAQGESNLGLVSHPDHLTRAAVIGSWVLTCSERQIVKLPVRQRVQGGRVIAPRREEAEHSTELESVLAADS